MVSIQLLIIFMIITAVIAVELKNMISSVIAIAALGFGLSLAFLILKAPDLAAVLLIVETVMLTFLVKATLETSRVEKRGSDFLMTVMVLVFIILFLILGYEALNEIPEFGLPLMKVSKNYIDAGVSKLNASNMLTSIALGFRGYDSLGALLILFAVSIGIKSITDKKRINK